MRSPQRRQDLGALARRRASVGPDADALPLGAIGQLVLNALGAGEAALAAPPLLDRPGEARLDGAGGLVDVVAVEAEARLQAQRVARAEADRLHAVLRQQQLRQRLRVLRRNRDLEAVLAGIAGAARRGNRSRRRARWPPS